MRYMTEKATRLEILKYYYNSYKTSHTAQSDCEHFTDEFNITVEELQGHIKYLDEKGLLKCQFTLYGKGICHITAHGIDVIENPEQHAKENPFLNLIVYGDVNNSQIIQAQDMKISNGFNKVYPIIEKLNSDNKTELYENVKELEFESTKKEPSLSKIKSTLKTIKKLEPRIFAIIAPIISDSIQHIIENI